MRTLFGWVLKAGIMGALYLGVTSGLQVKLPDTILGFKVPDQAHQFVARTAQIADYGKSTQTGLKGIADSLK
jgi:hypothetical protein